MHSRQSLLAAGLACLSAALPACAGEEVPTAQERPRISGAPRASAPRRTGRGTGRARRAAARASSPRDDRPRSRGALARPWWYWTKRQPSFADMLIPAVYCCKPLEDE
ncbi:uncharacterized protein SOCEGT47_050820 [Sorangium cellulosum]|uniref:Secreted protein n=1 Tax=Sorangium cellulosum TaxID=56 RepID=A0A4P2Q553_SORCE|nr:uncharacterized protein SOCEGT47_050820 [Sorangium cellulosum]